MKRFFEWFVTPLKKRDPLPSGEELRRRINQLIEIGITPEDALVQLARALNGSPAEVQIAMESPATDTPGDSAKGAAALIMKVHARWAQNYYKSPELPIVQQTLIACWLPWKYYFASTVQVSDGYVTQVFRCDKYGWVRSLDNPLLQWEYSGLDEAIEGHKEAVKKFARGATIYDRHGLPS